MEPREDIVFEHDPENTDPWFAKHAAERYCQEQGWSIGAMQADAPMAVYADGAAFVGKWRTLTAADKREMLATIEPVAGPHSRRWKHCDVVVRFRR